MINDRTKELLNIINCHAEFLEEQAHYFSMMRSLIEVALSGDFIKQPSLISHYYLLAMSEIMEKSSGQNEASLALLRQCMDYITS